MAKKKKEANTVTDTSVKYEGQVTVEKVRGNKVVKKSVIKNVGCFSLFKFFADCLTLYNDENADRVGLFNSKPQYLNCFYVNVPDPSTIPSNLTFSSHEIIKSYIRQSSTNVISNNPSQLGNQSDAYCNIELKFLLQDSNFKYQDDDQIHRINAIALYSGSNVMLPDQPMAYILIPVSSALKYEAGVNYIITWTLRISN